MISTRAAIAVLEENLTEIQIRNFPFPTFHSPDRIFLSCKNRARCVHIYTLCPRAIDDEHNKSSAVPFLTIVLPRTGRNRKTFKYRPV